MSHVDYQAGRETLRLLPADGLFTALADRLWDRADAGAEPTIEVRLEWTPSPPEAPPVPERGLVWRFEPRRLVADIEPHLHAEIDLERPAVLGWASLALLREEPALVARYLLEAPTAYLFSRRAYDVLHAGGVVGPAGAVVLRGASGAGKSTLIAACWKSGLAILGDESLLVAREAADELLPAVRDLTLLPEGAVAAGVLAETVPAFSGGEEKLRIDLFAGSRPALRRARRAATVLLGEREPGPARLTPLSAEAFLKQFPEGAIPEERLPGSNPDRIAARWAGNRTFRLDGAGQLSAAVSLIRGLAH